MSNYVTKHGEIIPSNMRSLISTRYQTITCAVNMEFWNSSSNSAHSLYVGSYGRGTAIDTSDIDILVEVPESTYRRYDTQKEMGSRACCRPLEMRFYPLTQEQIFVLMDKLLRCNFQTE